MPKPPITMVEATLEAAGFNLTETNIEQMTVLLQCMDLFNERNKKYGDLWKEYGWRGNLLHVQSKAARVRKVWWDGEIGDGYATENLDDAFDLINYTAFFIRNVEGKNELGRR